MGKTRGFTLIELMVTIAIFAIITMLAVPTFGNILAEKRLESVTRDLALALGDIRGQAVTLRKNIVIKFAKGTSTSTVYYWSPKYQEVKIDESDVDISFSDVVYTAVGVPSQRKVEKLNPYYQEGQPTDLTTVPPTNPKTIEVVVPLKFKLCNPEIGKSRIISISLNGSVQQIDKGECKKNV